MGDDSNFSVTRLSWPLAYSTVGFVSTKTACCVQQRSFFLTVIRTQLRIVEQGQRLRRYSLGVTWYNVFKVGLINLDFFREFSCLRETGKKRYDTRFGDLASQKQACFGYGIE